MALLFTFDEFGNVVVEQELVDEGVQQDFLLELARIEKERIETSLAKNNEGET